MGAMRVDFVGHATLLVRHGGLTILSDPWWTGPAYRGQWYPYPLPVPERYDLTQVDAVYISHSHEDHLHAGTLREFLKLAPNAEAIIPLRYDTQMRDYLQRIGFRRIREARSGVPFMVRKGGDTARLTVITHMDDSLVAIEAGGQVLINANDALHSSRRELIDEYCRILRGRFPSLDYLFCGFGGASYFPNCIRVPGKDDVAVARAREYFFLDNFARVAQQLTPRIAVPFAAHFVLPDERNWWISATRLRMAPPSETVRHILPNASTTFVDLQPGDHIEDGQIHASEPPVNPDVNDARDAVLARYPAARQATQLDAAAFETLLDAVRSAIERHPSPEPLDAVLSLWDYPQRAIHIRVGAGPARVEPIDTADVDSLSSATLVFETRSDLVLSTIRSSFGRDLITIGYGAQVRLRTRDAMTSAPQDRLIALLAPAQLRTLSFIVGDPSMRLPMARALRRGRRSATPPGRERLEPGLYAIRDWAELAQLPE
jgi:Beta-lactamase superfamily domain